MLETGIPVGRNTVIFTPWTNIASENWWLQDDFFPFWEGLLAGAILVSGRVNCFKPATNPGAPKSSKWKIRPRPISDFIDPSSTSSGVIAKIATRYMGVSKNRGTPKSSILIGFSIINHPFWGIPIFGNTHIGKWTILLMVQKSGVHQLRLVVYPIVCKVYINPRWCRISFHQQ